MIKETKNLTFIKDGLYKINFPTFNVSLAVNYFKKDEKDAPTIRPMVKLKDIDGMFYLDLDGDGHLAEYQLLESMNRVINFPGLPFATEVYVEINMDKTSASELSIYAIAR